ncbi:hypothetical protein JXO59_04070 [candidate division KSB1 bacterium]|nr:hypothetical protein [candidate division KSB1 bacterium]
MGKKSTNPRPILQLEEKCRQLRTLLQSDAAGYLKCVSFISFFHHLQTLPQQERFASFYIECVHWLKPICYQLPQTGWDPVRYELALAIIRDFGSYAEASHTDELIEAEQQVRLRAAIGYLYLGESEKVCRLLDWKIACEDEAMASESEQAENMIQRGLKHGQPLSGELQEAWQHWSKRLQDYSADSLAAVFVDQSISHIPGEQLNGMIIDLHASSHLRPRDAEEDRVLLNNNVRFGKDSLYWTLLDAARAASRLAFVRLRQTRHSSFEYSVDEKEALLAGSSMGLAAVVLAYAALINGHYHTPVVRLSRSAVITGGIKPDGAVTAVDGGGLAAKVAAAFFSPMSRLFVPSANLTMAVHHLEKLQLRYPHRLLTIHGLETLQQAVQDQNLMRQRPITPVVRTWAVAKRIKYKKSILAALALVAVLILFSHFKTLHWWRDLNPTGRDVEGQYFIAKSRGGEELWRYDFGSPLQAVNYINDEKNIKFTDLDGNGRNEVLIGTRESGSSELSGAVYCLSDRGRLLWRYKPGRVMTFGAERFTDHYTIHNIVVGRLSNTSQEKVILVNAHHLQYYPNILTLLTAEGEFSGEYWNSGVLEALLITDLHRDGKNEIIAGGYDNETGRAVLMALDPLNMSGASPQNPDGNYIARGILPGTQLHYLRFPPSIFSTRIKRDCAYQISSVDDYIEVAIHNNYLYNLTRSNAQSGMYSYYLDHDMKVISLNLDDPYELRFFELTGKPFGPSEVQKLKRVEYWQGDKWVKR